MVSGGSLCEQSVPANAVSIMAAAGVQVVFMHWDTGTPVLKSNVQQTFIKFHDDPAGYTRSLDSVSNFLDAGDYLTNYARFWVAISQTRLIPNEIVMVDEYAEVSYMRLSASIQVWTRG